MEEPDEKKKEKKPVVYTHADLINFERNNGLSAFGTMQLSHKSSAPCYGFGKASRKDQEKVFMSKAVLKGFLGKNSQQMYNVTDKFDYINDPRWSFSKGERNTLDVKPKYEHYHIQDTINELDSAVRKTKWASPNIKVGHEKRFKDPSLAHQTPGAKYNPGFQPHLPGQPLFSFGPPPKKMRGKTVGHSTPANIGPNAYFKEGYPEAMIKSSFPSHKMPKQLRFKGLITKNMVNETYDDYHGVGVQQRSDKLN